ncbi:MerR family transcriptional regulator [Paenibacillus sp. H1-7]|uniref:MerR family transcriptional regulator n=1 Tax=Paenibacillus sp. H1-7 TaxID=2282849 RepID=UPI001EF90734|nr:MerR family transcriptional regulator [Paenibacillus sp. H1-7]
MSLPVKSSARNEGMVIKRTFWKVGDLAGQTGLTVRTLHHYDEIGLFSPSMHSESGHRLYSQEDIAKLQQILSLKQLGFTLEEIKEILSNPYYNKLEVIKFHLDGIKEQIRIKEQMHEQLERIYQQLLTHQEVTAEQFIQLIGVTQMNADNYFTKEQMEKMTEHFGSLEQRALYVKEWAAILANLRIEMAKGTPAESLDVTRLAELQSLLTGGGDLSLINAMKKYYMDFPETGEKFGLDAELSEYMKKALASAGK